MGRFLFILDFVNYPIFGLAKNILPISVCDTGKQDYNYDVPWNFTKPLTGIILLWRELCNSALSSVSLKYTTFDTRAKMDAEEFPSTPGQLVLARALVEELRSLGMSEIDLDENGYLMATLPATTKKTAPTIGFIAHLDTSYEMAGANVKAQFVDYQGGDIVLNAENGIVLSPHEFPDLNKYVGKRLITTDGTTLLGADDKAGIAAIMAALEHLIAHPEIDTARSRSLHPDEEVGHGADRFDVAKFGADFAYTLDGGGLASCSTRISTQQSVHLGQRAQRPSRQIKE